MAKQQQFEMNRALFPPLPPPPDIIELYVYMTNFVMCFATELEGAKISFIATNVVSHAYFNHLVWVDIKYVQHVSCFLLITWFWSMLQAVATQSF